MAARFQTKVVRRRARFEVAAFTPQQMIQIAQPVRDDIEARILRAQDTRDLPAPPLKQPQRNVTGSRNARTVNGITLVQLPGKQYRGYPFYKQNRGGRPVRDWKLTGRTLRSMKVVRAGNNQAVIGFTDPVSNMRAAVNNRRWRQFGMSPANKRVFIQAVMRQKIVRVTSRVA